MWALAVWTMPGPAHAGTYAQTVSDFKFNSRVRATDESAATYVAALRQIAEHSDYKDSLQDMLQDRLVCGVNHPVIQRRLLAEKDDTALGLLSN